MTGNVAQVFITDREWTDALADFHLALRPGGCFVFETRRPQYRAWEEWAAEPPTVSVITPAGVVTRTFSLTAVSWPTVSFRYVFLLPDGSTATSLSTLRFRTRREITEDLQRAGFTLLEVRQAPDRPGMEYVFIARRD